MKVYAVQSEKLGLLKVFANYESALYFLRGAVETHSAYCGKVVWLDASLKGLANHNGAIQGTVCNEKWESQDTVSISGQDVLNLV